MNACADDPRPSRDDALRCSHRVNLMREGTRPVSIGVGQRNASMILVIADPGTMTNSRDPSGSSYIPSLKRRMPCNRRRDPRDKPRAPLDRGFTPSVKAHQPSDRAFYPTGGATNAQGGLSCGETHSLAEYTPKKLSRSIRARSNGRKTLFGSNKKWYNRVRHPEFGDRAAKSRVPLRVDHALIETRK